jgi:hypothetical protein
MSIPWWAPKYAKYGIYAPTLLATIWIIFDGCPLTKFQSNLAVGKFSHAILNPIWPTISSEQATRVSYLTLLLITLGTAWNICPEAFGGIDGLSDLFSRDDVESVIHDKYIEDSHEDE